MPARAPDASAHPDQPPRKPLLRTILVAPFTAWTWRRTAYGIVSLPMAAVCFALVVPGFLVSLPLVVVFGLGLVLGLVFLWISRGLAALERARVGWMLATAIPAPEPLATRGHPGRRWWARIRTLDTWRRLAFMLTNLPLSLVTTFLCLYPWVQTVYSLSYPIVQWNTTFTEHAWGGPSWLGAVAVHTLPGIPMLFLAPWLVRAATWLHASWVRLLLGARPRSSETSSAPADGATDQASTRRTSAAS